MNYEERTSTSAPREHAWAVLADVTSLPQLTPSMRSVTPLDGTELAVGRRYRINQPGLPPVVWTVTDVVPGRSFRWEARSPGVYTVADHEVTANADGSTAIFLSLRQSGALAGLVALLTAAKTRRYMALEAAGLKAASEAATRAA